MDFKFVKPSLYILFSGAFVSIMIYLLWTNNCSIPKTTESPVRAVSIPVPRDVEKIVLPKIPDYRTRTKQAYLVIPRNDIATTFLQSDFNKVLATFRKYDVEFASESHLDNEANRGGHWDHYGWVKEGKLLRPERHIGARPSKFDITGEPGYVLYGYKPIDPDSINDYVIIPWNTSSSIYKLPE